MARAFIGPSRTSKADAIVAYHWSSFILWVLRCTMVYLYWCTHVQPSPPIQCVSKLARAWCWRTISTQSYSPAYRRHRSANTSASLRRQTIILVLMAVRLMRGRPFGKHIYRNCCSNWDSKDDAYGANHHADKLCRKQFLIKNKHIIGS